eukprot:TRINITY_DN70871_c0_g1_i1.p1 TRINITY_DN70871_c0_g1~~TRINITY_DN70871_c0_g1_i1.p1  ORF type:complete len:298 (+),score=27.57 TRINITY_DN70871_c0_g1_i1:106-999(+)
MQRAALHTSTKTFIGSKYLNVALFIVSTVEGAKIHFGERLQNVVSTSASTDTENATIVREHTKHGTPSTNASSQTSIGDASAGVPAVPPDVAVANNSVRPPMIPVPPFEFKKIGVAQASVAVPATSASGTAAPLGHIWALTSSGSQSIELSVAPGEPAAKTNRVHPTLTTSTPSLSTSVKATNSTATGNEAFLPIHLAVPPATSTRHSFGLVLPLLCLVFFLLPTLVVIYFNLHAHLSISLTNKSIKASIPVAGAAEPPPSSPRSVAWKRPVYRKLLFRDKKSAGNDDVNNAGVTDS